MLGYGAFARAEGYCEISIHLKNLSDPKKSEKRLIQRKRDSQDECQQIVNEFKPKLSKREILEITVKWVPVRGLPW